MPRIPGQFAILIEFGALAANGIRRAAWNYGTALIDAETPIRAR